MNLAQELKSRTALLDHVGWQEATARIVGLLKWMNEQPEIKHVLDDLKNRGRVYEQLNIGTDRRRVAAEATDPRDVATIGLAMAEACSARNGIDQFHQIAHSFGVQPLQGMVHPADFLANRAIELYLRPLVNYVLDRLPEERPAAIMAEPSRERLTFEFLQALFDEYERDPLPTHWIDREEIWKRVIGKYGDNVNSELVTSAIRHLYAGRFINQVSGGSGVDIQISEQGIEAYRNMKASSASAVPTSDSDPKTVFVVHGRNEPARKAMFDFLRAIGLKPLEWSQAIRATGEASPYIGQVLDTAFSMAEAIVVLMTADDLACLCPELQTENDEEYEKQPTGQARPNVLFEAGMAMGRNPKRTVLVEIGKLRPFSDVGGRHVLRLNNSSERRQELANRLRTAGCEVDLSGTDWHSVGDFEAGGANFVRPAQELISLASLFRSTAEQNLTPAEGELVLGARDGRIQTASLAFRGRIVMGMPHPDDAEIQAKYLDALDSLLTRGLVRLEGSEAYRLTGRGFEVQKMLAPPNATESKTP